MESLIEEIKVLMGIWELNAKQRLGGNKSAGKRGRKVSLDIERKLKVWRKMSLGEEE